MCPNWVKISGGNGQTSICSNSVLITISSQICFLESCRTGVCIVPSIVLLLVYAQADHNSINEDEENTRLETFVLPFFQHQNSSCHCYFLVIFQRLGLTDSPNCFECSKVNNTINFIFCKNFIPSSRVIDVCFITCYWFPNNSFESQAPFSEFEKLSKIIDS